MRHTLEGAVVAVAADNGHRFSKPVQDQITLVKGHGVDGDAHAGQYVRHRYLARRHRCLPSGGRADRPADALRPHRPLQNRPKKTGLVVGNNGPCIQMRRPGRGASWRTGGSRRLRARHSVRRMSEAASFAVALGKKEPSLYVTVGGDF